MVFPANRRETIGLGFITLVHRTHLVQPHNLFGNDVWVRKAARLLLVSAVSVHVRPGRELILPNLGNDYSNLWDALVVKNSNTPWSHLYPRQHGRVMYMCAAEPAFPSPLLFVSHWMVQWEFTQSGSTPFYQKSISVPSSLQSFLYPCEARHSEIPSSIN